MHGIESKQTMKELTGKEFGLIRESSACELRVYDFVVLVSLFP